MSYSRKEIRWSKKKEIAEKSLDFVQLVLKQKTQVAHN
jgi:hypothetical protein